MGFPGSPAGKESTCTVGDPGSGRSSGEGIGYPSQYSWASLVAQLVKNLPAMQETYLGTIPGLRRSPGEREWLPTPVFWPGEFHGLYSCKESDTTKQLSPFKFY